MSTSDPAVTLLDGLGLIGVASMLVAYGLTISGRVAATDRGVLVANLVGALLVLASLWGAFNLSSMLIETAWAIIAFVGLVRRGRRR